MTRHDTPLTGANETGCTLEVTGLWVRARVERPRRHADGLLFDLRPLDPGRAGCLTAFLSAAFIQQIQEASGVLLDADSLAGEHMLMLTLVVDPLLGVRGQIIGFDRGAFLPEWVEQDAAVREAMEAAYLWQRQHDLPLPRRLRRVFLIEPDDGAPHPLGDALARWWACGAIELIRHPVAFEQPGSVGALRHAFDCAIDQYEWGSLDLVIVEPGSGFAFRALSDDGLMRQAAVLPVPIVTHRAGVPTLIEDMAFRSFDHSDEILAFLSGILREELRRADRPRLAAIAELVEAPPAADATAETQPFVQGPLFD